LSYFLLVESYSPVRLMGLSWKPKPPVAAVERILPFIQVVAAVLSIHVAVNPLGLNLNTVVSLTGPTREGALMTVQVQVIEVYVVFLDVKLIGT